MNPPLLKIRIYGDPCLRKKSEPVNEIGPGERILIHSMIHTMNHNQGIGLAAPQIGVNRRIFVVDVGDGPIAIINPLIIKESGSAVQEEGCLSIPEVTINVKRAKKIWIQYLDEHNNLIERIHDDLMARVILHETDHLDGNLITDYATPAEKRKWEKKLDKMTDQETKQ